MRVETPKQYSARHLRLAIEKAKAAVMDAQEQAQEFRGNPAAFVQILDAAFSRLDSAWSMAWQAERQERDRDA